MGLDWLPGDKAKPDYEVEFVEISGQLKGRREDSEERDRLMARYKDISISASETLVAPRVGRDPDADEWARQVYREMEDRPDSEAEFLSGLEGFAVLPLVPPCDGLPRYTNGWPGGYVDLHSFRGQFLDDCENDIGKKLLNAAY